MAYHDKPKHSACITTLQTSINPYTIEKLKSIGKLFPLGFLISQGVFEATLTTKEETYQLSVLAFKMQSGSYHCINYPNYPKEPRFLNASSDKNIPCELGLLGSSSGDSPIYLVEGIWDYLMMKLHGYNCIGLPGVNNFRKEWLNNFRGKIVYVCFDNDETGKKYAQAHAAKLCGVASRICIINLPESIGANKIKDISDFFNFCGNDAKAQLNSIAGKSPIHEYDVIQSIKDRLLGKGDVQNKGESIASDIINDIENVNGGNIIPYDRFHDIAVVDGGKRIVADDKVDEYLSRHYNYSDSDALWRLVRDKLYNHAVKKENVNMYLYTTYLHGKCYIGINDEGILILDGENSNLELQGYDNVYLKSGKALFDKALFKEDNNAENFNGEYSSFEEILDLFNFETSEHKFLIKAWFYHTFFNPGMRPILTLYAEKGCGKTLLQKIMKGILFGFDEGTANPNTMPAEDHSLLLMLKESKYLFFDEVDKYDIVMKSYLRMLATGAEIVFRPKYSKDNVRFIPNIWLSLATNSPKFRDEDIAQRLVIVKLLPFVGKSIRENIFFSQLSKNRNKIYYNLLKQLQKILFNLKNPSEIPLVNYCRQTEFAHFAWNAFPEERDVCIRAFDTINQQQSEFSSELDPIMDLFENWIIVNKVSIQDGKKFLCKEIYEGLINMPRHREIKYFPVSVKAMSKWIASRAIELGDKYGMEKTDYCKLHIVHYSFSSEKCGIMEEIF